ncbi:MAG: hypothetical protein RLZZ305_1390 [Actinomycetota bacterium]|jgi:hypothetical protein
MFESPDATAPDPTWVTDNAQTLTNVAVTDFAADMVTEHVPVPEHAPDHAENRQPESAVAVRTTAVLLSKSADCDAGSAVPNEMPVTSDEIDPSPVLFTVNDRSWMNVAVTDFAAVIETEHGLVEPLHAPVHAENRQPEAAVADRETEAPVSYVCESDSWPVAVEMLLSAAVTDPEPTCERDRSNTRTNVAVIDFDAVMETEHGLVEPLHAPVHAENRQPAAGDAASETVVESSRLVDCVVAETSEIPDGVDVTLPDPTWVTESSHTRTNVAVTFLASDIVTVHVVDDPEHAPPQPRNSPVPDGVAVSVTDVPSANDFAHVPEPSMQPVIPDGLESMVPPSPMTVTARVFAPGGTRENVAVTDLSAAIVRLHVDEPEQSPVHPSKM